MARHEIIDATEPEAPPPQYGLAAITAEFAAKFGGNGQAAAQGPSGLAEVPRARPGPFEIWPLRLPVLFLNAAGTIDGASTDWACPTGRAWELLGVTITLGTGTTLVQVYDEAAQSANLLFQTTVSGIWGPAKILLPGERIVVVSTGGGVTLRLTEGNQLDLGYLPAHLT